MILATNSPVRPTEHSLSKPLCLLRFPYRNLGFGRRPDRGICRLLLAQGSEMGFIRKLSIFCFTGRAEKGQKVEVDSVSGGQDIFDPAPEVHPDHLVIMVNGIIGSSEDWKYAAEQFVKKLSDKVIVHQSMYRYSSRKSVKG